MTRVWSSGLPETICGMGSTMTATKAQRKWIPELVVRHNIKSIADIGAGDMNWMRRVNLPSDVEYTPYDIRPHGTMVVEMDITKEIPPRVDLIMCIWVLNHLGVDDCATALDNIRKSGSKYILISDKKKYRIKGRPNIDLGVGVVDRLRLRAPDGEHFSLILLSNA